MQILSIHILNGPNYWSNYWKHLIVVKLDLKQYEERPTHLLPGFTDRLTALMPSLYEHRCSVGEKGGFIKRLKKGTWLSHVIEHVALELQCLAGMDCGYGRARPTHEKGIYNIVFSYEVENAGIYAAKAAIKIVSSIAKGKTYSSLKKDIDKLKNIAAKEGLGISTKMILEEARARNIPRTALDQNSLFMLGYGCNQKRIMGAYTSDTSSMAVDIACDKDFTKQILKSSYIPVPKGFVVNTVKKLEAALKDLDFPLVIKPLNGNHGKAVTTNIVSKEGAIQAFKLAQKISNKVVVERFIKGSDFRFLVVNHKVVTVMQRIPAFVVGDGTSTIKELIDAINSDPNRGEDHDNLLTKIKIDGITKSILNENNLKISSVLPKNYILYLKYAANLSSGGTPIDVTDQVHPENIFLAERVARLINLNICGIDIVAQKIDLPINETTGAVIEVNAVPGLRMHLYTANGKKRNVVKPILDMLFPENMNSRIPIVAVTGTNGKTTTVRLIASFASLSGFSVGFTSTDGVYIRNNTILHGDCSGPKSARAVLQDPSVDFAVLECARGGILREGLGFDRCNVSIVLNVSEDHLGLGGIETLDELARVKSVVPHSTMKEGYAVLNADDDLVYEMKNNLNCNIAFFSLHENNPRVHQHMSAGGLAAYLENNCVIVVRDNIKTNVINVNEIPFTFFGTARFMVQNILAAVLAAIASNFKIADLQQWLKNIKSTPEFLPGRMNVFNVGDCNVLLDYAHNTGAYIELKEYLQSIKRKKIGIIGMPGDRRDEDIKNIGIYSAQIFDEIIIRHDKDGRGRSNNEISELLYAGIKSYNPTLKITIISDEQKALEFALENANSNNLIVYCPEDVFKAITFLSKLELQHQQMREISNA